MFAVTTLASHVKSKIVTKLWGDLRNCLQKANLSQWLTRETSKCRRDNPQPPKLSELAADKLHWYFWLCTLQWPSHLTMAFATTACTCSSASQLLPRTKFSTLTFPASSSASYTAISIIKIPCLRTTYRNPSIHIAAAKRNSNAVPTVQVKEHKKEQVAVEEVEEEDLPWIQEKALDLVEFTGSVTQALPGPRVGSSSLPWIIALPLAYAGLTFVIAFVKTVRKFTSPREKRRRLVRLYGVHSMKLCYWDEIIFIHLHDGFFPVCSGH